MKIEIDESSKRKIRNRKLITYIIYAIVILEITWAALTVFSKIFGFGFIAFVELPDDKSLIFYLVALMFFCIIVGKIVLHDPHFKLSDYEKRQIQQYGLIHFTSVKEGKNIKRIKTMDKDISPNLFFPNKPNRWFYMCGDKTLIESFNNKKKFVNHILDNATKKGEGIALLRIKINEKDIKKLRVRLGDPLHHDDALYYYGMKLDYIKADLYEYKDGELKEVK